MAAVPLSLRNDITGFKAETTTAADGTFQFFNVPYNPYEIHAEVQGFKPMHMSIDIRSAAPMDVTLSMQLPGLSESVTVTAEPTASQLETDSSVSPWTWTSPTSCGPRPRWPRARWRS